MEAAKESNKEQKRVESVNEEFNHRPVIFRRCGMQTRKERLMAVTKKWKLFDREPPSLALILGAEHRGWIPIHTHTLIHASAREARGEEGWRRKSGVLFPRGEGGGHVKGVARRWLKRGGGGGGGLKGARGGGRGPGYSLSVHKRATVHTPKRVFVRFHFTPNYLAHIGAHTVGEGGGEGGGKTRRRDKRCVARRCGVKIHRNVGEGGGIVGCIASPLVLSVFRGFYFTPNYCGV